MSVKICGHEVRLGKPIKIYTLLKTLIVLIALGSLFVSTTLFAAEPSSPNCKASPVEAAPCLPLHTPRMEKNLPVPEGSPERTQRKAGSSSVPAMAIVMALGLTSVQGPIERNMHRPTQDMSTNPGMAIPPRIAMER